MEEMITGNNSRPNAFTGPTMYSSVGSSWSACWTVESRRWSGHERHPCLAQRLHRPRGCCLNSRRRYRKGSSGSQTKLCQSPSLPLSLTVSPSLPHSIIHSILTSSPIPHSLDIVKCSMFILTWCRWRPVHLATPGAVLLSILLVHLGLTHVQR